MTTQLEILDARGRFDELLDRARSGEEFVVAEKGKPILRIGPIGKMGNERIFGEFAGKINMSEDFAAPLSADELTEWER